MRERWLTYISLLLGGGAFETGRAVTELSLLVLKIRLGLIVTPNKGHLAAVLARLALEHVLRAGEQVIHLRLVVAVSDGSVALPLLGASALVPSLLRVGGDHDV